MTPTTEELAKELEAILRDQELLVSALPDDFLAPVPVATLRAAAARLRELEDTIEDLRADLYDAVGVAFRRGALTWTKANYPARYEQMMAASRVELADEGTRAAQLMEPRHESKPQPCNPQPPQPRPTQQGDSPST